MISKEVKGLLEDLLMIYLEGGDTFPEDNKVVFENDGSILDEGEFSKLLKMMPNKGKILIDVYVAEYVKVGDNIVVKFVE